MTKNAGGGRAMPVEAGERLRKEDEQGRKGPEKDRET